MKALIIAAGKGTRLESLTKDEPKPLIQLLGLSLIERVILTARQVGIDEFVIVIGYRGEKIKEKLEDGNRYGVKITCIENREWQRGNGVSVLKAKELLNENFVLLMSDHIFDVRILKELIDCGTRSSVVLAIDRRKPLQGDTKVLEKEGRIAAIGKNIGESNCIDTGIFLCSPKIFSHIEEAVKEGKTERGWLLIYHGVGELNLEMARSYGLKRGIKRAYSVSAAILDLENPRDVLCRTKMPIYIPSKPYELYGDAVYPVDVPAVVFPTGIVVVKDKLFLYCGSGDKYVILLTCDLDNLLDYLRDDLDQEKT